MDKPPEATAEPVIRRFEDWRKVFNPFLRAVTAKSRYVRFRVRWARVFAALLVAVLCVYLSLAAGAYGLVRFQQEVSEVDFLDFAVPTRWARVRIARGNHHIAKAQALADAGQRLPALFMVRRGLERSPANRDGRLLLAQLLMEAGHPELTAQVLSDGLAFHHDDPLFLRPFFSFLFRRQSDADVIAIARKYLPHQPSSTERDRLYSFAAATAAYFRGNFDLAEDFLRAPPTLETSRDGRLLLAKMEWERGYRDLALLRFRELAAAFPDDAEVHSELASHLDHGELHDEVRRTALAFQIAHPTLAGPRLELLRAYQRTGDQAQAGLEIEAFVRDFANDPNALVALADFAANSGNTPLARRLTDLARARHFAWEPHAILAVEALVVARDYHGALEDARALLHANPDWTARFGPVLNSLQAIAHFGLADHESANLLLTNYLNQSYLRAENLLAIAQRLVDVDAADAARQVLIRAVAADPFNQAALTRLVELDLNLNRIDELPAHLTRLLAMRKPPPDILRVAQHKLGSDLFLFSAERPAVLESVRLALEKSSAVSPRM